MGHIPGRQVESYCVAWVYCQERKNGSKLDAERSCVLTVQDNNVTG